ncbi:MAG: type II toxin-antitoxin system VapB family antitoxin [Roseitalea porphyridii]|nr:type II toxin-antitoxin system VapB family antitoxin [Roseitalea porphyridii]
MGLNIKNERVHELARELAALRNESMTSVIKKALENELERERNRDDEARLARIEAKQELMAHIRAMDELPAGVSSDHSDFYDDDGFPA